MGQVFYNQHINKVTPHLRRAQNADTYALKQPCLVLVTSDMHLESESEKRAKNVDFLKISSYNQHFFTLFRRVLIN